MDHVVHILGGGENPLHQLVLRLDEVLRAEQLSDSMERHHLTGIETRIVVRMREEPMPR